MKPWRSCSYIWPIPGLGMLATETTNTFPCCVTNASARTLWLARWAVALSSGGPPCTPAVERLLGHQDARGAVLDAEVQRQLRVRVDREALPEGGRGQQQQKEPEFHEKRAHPIDSIPVWCVDALTLVSSLEFLRVPTCSPRGTALAGHGAALLRPRSRLQRPAHSERLRLGDRSHFDTANRLLAEQSMARACDAFKDFLRKNPSSPLAREAKVKGDRACIKAGKGGSDAMQAVRAIADDGQTDLPRALANLLLVERGETWTGKANRDRTAIALELFEAVARGSGGRWAKEARSEFFASALQMMEQQTYNTKLVEELCERVLGPGALRP